MEKKIEILVTANEYLDNLKKGIESIINYIEADNEVEACRLIADVSEGIGWVLDVVRLTSDVHKGMISTSNIESNIEEVVSALENEDYILVGDLFNYEILPEIEKVHKEIEKFL